MRRLEPHKDRYSIRKFTVGAASVLIGLTFTGMAQSKTVHAATVKPDVEKDVNTKQINQKQVTTEQTLQVKKQDQDKQASQTEQTPKTSATTQTVTPKAAAATPAQKQGQTASQTKPQVTSLKQAKMVTPKVNTQLKVAKDSFATSTTTNQDSKVDQNTSQTIDKNAIAQVNSWSDLVNALANSQITTINLNGNIVATSDIQITGDRKIEINGAKVSGDVVFNKDNNANINFGSHTITSSGQLDLTVNNTNISSTSMSGAIDLSKTYGQNNVTFNNVSSTGSSLYNGGGNTTVYIKGTVESEVNNSAPAGWTSLEGKSVANAGTAADYRDRRPSNIGATNLEVASGATLTLTRTAQGSGIELKNGGTVHLADGANLNVTLNSPSPTDAAVQIQENGHFLTDGNNNLNLVVGQGRGLEIGQNRRTNSAATSNMNQYPEWGSYTGTDNKIILGQNTSFNFQGRDGMLMGDHSTFTSGEGSHITFHNQGNGVAFDSGDDTTFTVSPHSVMNLNSVGKNHSGDWAHSNYIGVNQNSSIYVLHDAQLMLNLTDRGSWYYNDTINMDSRGNGSKAEFYVGDNAVLSIASDGTDYYPELISVPLGGGTQANFIFDNVRYVNLQKNSVILGHDNNPNLIFMSGAKGVFEGKGLYKIYQWTKRDFNGQNVNYTSEDDNASNYEALQKQLESIASNTWTGISNFNLPWSDFNPKQITGTTMNGQSAATLMSNNGVSFTDKANGFNPQTAQRLVITSMTIPEQETKTQKTPIPYEVIRRYSSDLEPGQVRVVQKGVDGYTETTTTTYYNVTTDADGNVVRKIDTSKGNNGVEVTTKTVNPVNEIIDWGGPLPSSVTVKYEIAGNAPDKPVAPEDTVEDGFKFDVSEIKPDGTLVWTTTTHTYSGASLPEVKGYTPYYEGKPITDGKIPAVEVTVTDPNKTITITYEKNAPVEDQKATLTIVDGDNHDAQIQISGITTEFNAQGASGTTIDFGNYENSVSQLETKGYTLESNNFKQGTTFDNDPNTVQAFQIVMRRVPVPVNPEHPTDKYTTEDLEKTVTRTINYNYQNGQKAADSVVQSQTFTASGYVDPITGNLVKVENGKIVLDDSGNEVAGTLTWSPNSASFDSVTSPVIANYTPSQKVVAQTSVTRTYGNQVVNVVYSPDQVESSISVVYWDKTNNVILQTKTLDGNVGQKADYSTASTIADYEKAGYKLQSDNYPADGATFTKDPQTYEVGLVHTYDKVTPDNPHGFSPEDLEQRFTQTVTYSGAGSLTPQPNVQTVTWSRTLTWDNVEKKIVTGEYTTNWTPDITTYKAVESPKVDGYQASVSEIPAYPTQMTNTHFNVVYSKNPTKVTEGKTIDASQIIKYVDTEGNVVAEQNTENFTFHKSGDVIDTVTGEVIQQGSWDATSHTFNTVNNPVVDGYITKQLQAGGFEATIDKPSQTIIVVYEKLGKIIPQTPDGKPIPNAPTPTYKNDPTNPTKVEPNEPVPNIPGYKPSVPTVTPTTPTSDTPVIYNYAETATINFIDVDDNDKIIATSGTLTGAPGSLIGYNPDSTLKELEAKGYEPVPNGSDYNSSTSTFGTTENDHKTFTIKMQHKQVPVGPDNPNPVPGSDVGKDDYEKDVTETVNYVGAGDKTPKPVVQNAQWTRTVTVDEVTGKIVPNGKYTTDWKSNKEDYDEVKTPVVDGYHADKAQVPATKVTMSDITQTVTYKQNSVIIPVDPEGKPIPNAPHPHYPTDPNTPTKVEPNEPVPNVPGYKPSVPTVTPENPDEPTKVIYNPDVNDQTVKVIFWDNTDNQEIPGFAPHVITAKPGTELDYNPDSTIKEIESKGYKLDHNGYDITKMPENGGTYRITFTHNIIHVTPDNPAAGYTAKDLEHSVTRTINYVGPDGSVAEPVVQTDKFTASGYYDEVTKQWVTVENGKETGTTDGPTWTPVNSSFDKVVSPTINGMHVVSVSSQADGTNVAAQNNVTHQTPDATITVTYSANGTIDEGGKTVTGKQTVNFVGPDGKPIASPNTQTTTFTKTPDVIDPITHQVIKKGSWNETSHTFKNVDSPVIKGYVTRETITKGSTVTPDDPDKTITVHYEKVGKIIPVGPDGQPIPNVPNPPYENDPNNPDQVQPDEPVPTIPGYTPSTKTVTPTDPTKDTKVIYNKNADEQTAIVQYIDQDENDKVIATSGTLTGKVGTTIDYSTASEIKKLESEGYQLVSNGFPNGAKFETNNGKQQVFKVVMKHGYASVTPDTPNVTPGKPINPDDPNGPKWPEGVSHDDLTKNITRTINYINGSNTKIAPSVVQTVHFGRTAIVDKVTGKIVGYSTDGKDQVTTTDGDKAWKVIGTDKFGSVTSPSVNGYTNPTPSVVGEETVVPSDKDSVVNVQYTPVTEPTPQPQPEPTPIPQPLPEPTPTPDDNNNNNQPEPEPDVPAPHGEDMPDNPNNTGDDNTQPQTIRPQAPITVSDIANNEPANNVDNGAESVRPHAQAQQLPQTGQKDSNDVLIAGLGLSLIGLLGLIDPEKRKKNS